MFDNYNRNVNYLRVSVTDRCNFRCSYCMPPSGTSFIDMKEILTYEEILRIIRVVSKYGVKKIRLTGGEPLVRLGLVELVREISQIGAIEDLSMTTNGSLLSASAQSLKAAGLNRVNISLDTLDSHKFALLTHCGKIEDTIRSIFTALEVGLTPVKINVVLTELFSSKDLSWLMNLIFKYPISIRFIEKMPIGCDYIKSGMDVVQVMTQLEGLGFKLQPVTEQKIGNGPAKYYNVDGAKGLLGFITPISDHFCGKCNRMRLTADGRFKPCLLSNKEIDIKGPLRKGISDDGIAELFFQAVSAKPEGHSLESEKYDSYRRMSQIGG